MSCSTAAVFAREVWPNVVLRAAQLPSAKPLKVLMHLYRAIMHICWSSAALQWLQALKAGFGWVCLPSVCASCGVPAKWLACTDQWRSRWFPWCLHSATTACAGLH